MYDNMNVWMDSASEPVLVEPITDDMWTYNDLAEKAKQKTTVAGMQLTIAYCQLVDPDPATLLVVKKWAREHRVKCEMVAAVDPTQPELSDGS